jgi:hypothetical protein
MLQQKYFGKVMLCRHFIPTKKEEINRGKIGQVKEIIETIKTKITSDTDLMWTNYNSSEELIAKINLNSILLEENKKAGLEFFQLLFLPTGTLQEISIQNGWSEEYLKLAAEFDSIYEKVYQLMKA